MYLVSSSFDDVNLHELNGKKIALTQSLSTYRYFTVSKFLKEIDVNLFIEQMKYRYVKTHSGVIKSIVQREFLLSYVKNNVAKAYENMSMKVLKTSPLVPSFVLVANGNSIAKSFIQELKSILLNTKRHRYKTWGDKIFYGMFAIQKYDFTLIMKDLKKIKIPNKGNF